MHRTLPRVAGARLPSGGGIWPSGLESIEGTKRLWKLSADLFRQTDDRSGLALALGGLALTAQVRGDLDRPAAFFEEGLGSRKAWGIIGRRGTNGAPVPCSRTGGS